MWPFKSRKQQAPAMTHESIVRAFLALFGDGAHFALFYATMNGFPDELINPSNIGEFSELILKEPDFTPERVSHAIARLIHSTEVLCRMPEVGDQAFGRSLGEIAHARADLSSLREAVVNGGSSALFLRAGFDPGEWLATVAVSRRWADLEAIAAKLEERKIYLKPLLLRARAKGKTKYGEIDWTEYVKELREFMAHYFPSAALPFFYCYPPMGFVFRVTDPWLDEEVDDLSIPVDGIDFEHWCAEQLAGQGWATRVSQASGDQGVDIEAMKSGFTVAIQCKRYTSPIGNKCVQEAYAGMVHYQANLACVIGTGGFTRSALELATTTGVLLVDAANIGAFSDLVSDHR